MKSKYKSLGVVRQRMKMDHLIIAIAIINGASAIYSYDNGLNYTALLKDSYLKWLETRSHVQLPKNRVKIYR
jgi:hypothetical protein